MKIKEFLSQNRRDFRAIFECEHCGRILNTKKEKDRGYCEVCHDRYNEEMHAIYGDDLYK